MIKVRNTPQLVGVTIVGDYEDLNGLLYHLPGHVPGVALYMVGGRPCLPGATTLPAASAVSGTLFHR